MYAVCALFEGNLGKNVCCIIGTENINNGSNCRHQDNPHGSSFHESNKVHFFSWWKNAKNPDVSFFIIFLDLDQQSTPSGAYLNRGKTKLHVLPNDVMHMCSEWLACCHFTLHIDWKMRVIISSLLITTMKRYTIAMEKLHPTILLSRRKHFIFFQTIQIFTFGRFPYWMAKHVHNIRTSDLTGTGLLLSYFLSSAGLLHLVSAKMEKSVKCKERA